MLELQFLILLPMAFILFVLGVSKLANMIRLVRLFYSQRANRLTMPAHASALLSIARKNQDGDDQQNELSATDIILWNEGKRHLEASEIDQSLEIHCPAEIDVLGAELIRTLPGTMQGMAVLSMVAIIIMCRAVRVNLVSSSFDRTHREHELMPRNLPHSDLASMREP